MHDAVVPVELVAQLHVHRQAEDLPEALPEPRRLTLVSGTLTAPLLAAEVKPMLERVDGLAADDIDALGFLEKGKYGLNVKTPQRRWQLILENDQQVKAWKKNLDSTIQLLAKGRLVG